MSIEEIDNHKAKACKCGSVNYALLKSGLVECNSCGVREAHWVTTPLDPSIEVDIRHERIAAIDKLRSKVTQAIGWAYADCCITLDKGGDPRQTEMPDVLARATKDLGL